MTTRRDFAAPVLDRLIRREVTTEVVVPATTAIRHDALETMSGNRIGDGEWRRESDTELSIGLNDSNGSRIPRRFAYRPTVLKCPGTARRATIG